MIYGGPANAITGKLRIKTTTANRRRVAAPRGPAFILPTSTRALTPAYFDGAATGGALAMYSGAGLSSCAKLKSLSANTALLALEDA